jgi:hypothetical protein
MVAKTHAQVAKGLAKAVVKMVVRGLAQHLVVVGVDKVVKEIVGRFVVLDVMMFVPPFVLTVVEVHANILAQEVVVLDASEIVKEIVREHVVENAGMDVQVDVQVVPYLYHIDDGND